MDAIVSADVRRRLRTAKPCGPGAPTQVLSLLKSLDEATETTKRGLSGESVEQP